MCERFGGWRGWRFRIRRRSPSPSGWSPATRGRRSRASRTSGINTCPSTWSGRPRGSSPGTAEQSRRPGRRLARIGGGRARRPEDAREAPLNAKARILDDDDDDTAGDAEATRLFVKGLSFNTTDAALRAHFLPRRRRRGGRVFAASGRHAEGPGGANLSRGFGFRRCSDSGGRGEVREARAMGQIRGTRCAKLEMSSGRKTDDGAVGGSGGSEKVPKGFSATKIVVRNVAFEATKRDDSEALQPLRRAASVPPAQEV